MSIQILGIVYFMKRCLERGAGIYVCVEMHCFQNDVKVIAMRIKVLPRIKRDPGHSASMNDFPTDHHLSNSLQIASLDINHKQLQCFGHLQ